MTAEAHRGRYRPTESKYKGGAQEMFVTYDLEQKTRGGDTASYPKVKRVYIAGDVKEWRTGTVKKRTGRQVHGVQIEYEQSRRGYHRRPFSARRGRTAYEVSPADVGRTAQKFVQVVEVPKKAHNLQFFSSLSKMPARYRHALQDVR